MFFNPAIPNRLFAILVDDSGDDFGEKAVILVLVVLAGVAAFSAFGQAVVDKIMQAASGI